MYEPDLALNHLQRLICHKTKPIKPFSKVLVRKVCLLGYHRPVR